MSGLCGWSGPRMVVDDGQERLKEMAASLGRFGTGTTQTRLGDTWGIALAGLDAAVDIAVVADGVAAVYGIARSRDSALCDIISRSGAATAALQAFNGGDASFLERLEGSFSLAVVLSNPARVLIATDGLGTVPVHFLKTPYGIVFSTTARVMRDSALCRLEVDPEVVYRYLYFHAVPSPYSIFKTVRKLSPGTFAEYRDGSIKVETYKRMSFRKSVERLNREELESVFHGLMSNSVTKCIEGSENVGCFLSGGTDSSTIAGVLARSLGKKTRTYSIGFDEEGYDEMEYARLASRHFGTDHNEYYVTPRDVANLIPKIPEIYGEPFGNSSAIPTYYCGKLAANDGVTRMLGGDGGDEVFGGNKRYGEQKIFGIYDRLPKILADRFVGPAAKSLPMSWFLTRKIRRYVEQAEIPMPQRMFTYNHLPMMGYNEILHPDFAAQIDIFSPEEDLAAVYGAVNADSMVDKMLALDMKFTIADNDLPKVVTMCELAGLEVQFPFLDEQLVEFANHLPASEKVRGIKLRYFFKRALRNFLPDEIIKKRKHGFGLPFGRWLENDRDLKEIVYDTMRTLQQRNIVNSKLIARLLDKKITEHSAYYGSFIWVLMQLELWYRDFESAVDRN